MWQHTLVWHVPFETFDTNADGTGTDHYDDARPCPMTLVALTSLN